MQFSCGGDVSTKTAERKPIWTEIALYQCKEFSRVSDAVLFIDGIEVAADRGVWSHVMRSIHLPNIARTNYSTPRG